MLFSEGRVTFYVIFVGVLVLLSIVLGVGAASAGEPDFALQQVPEQWASSGVRYNDTDSVAAARLASGALRVFATSKLGSRIDVFDGASGQFVTWFGGRGSDAGEVKRPNGICVVDFSRVGAGGGQVLAVVERDGRRVQAFDVETLRPLGTFGEGKLMLPYGCAVSYANGRVFLYVTDNFCFANRTVRVFEVSYDGERLQARYVRRFGDLFGDGLIKKAESIVVDDAHDRVFLCDEFGKNVKVYRRDGRFTGTVLAEGLVRGEPEGLALTPPADGGAGYLVVTDQRLSRSIWHLYDRQTLQHVAAFTGAPRVKNTDGICVFAGAAGPFERGALFAVNNNSDVRAYRLSDIDALAVAAEEFARAAGK